LVLGAGIAGLRAALGIDSRHRVLVVSKDRIAESNSAYAQGGIASVMDPEDHFDDHIADTLAAGKGLCDPVMVDLVVREAPERIAELIEWGTRFDLEDGQVTLGREGGHSHARIVHAFGDATGREVMRVLIERARARPSLKLWQNSFTLDLITHEGRCRGALVWDQRRGLSMVWAAATILATGGAGQLYRESTNPAIATADGHALAFRAGAQLRDMEFMQFHPTVLYLAGSSRHLLTEALRGEGARLVDCHGHRFMPEYHELAELAPRDDVSRAIVAQMNRTQHPCVYLDLSHLDADAMRERFPGIDAVCRSFDLDFTRDRIPVRPGAHYYIGGVLTDARARSTLPGLWAAGEVTSTGLHGANRLASNSLLEGLVMGACAAADINQTLDQLSAFRRLEVPPMEPATASPVSQRRREPLDLADIRNSLRSLMWRQAGIIRTAESLADAANQVDRWSSYALAQTFDDPAGWTLQNLLVVARLLIASASMRTESRGVHTRQDYPETDPEWAQHITWSRRGDSPAEHPSVTTSLQPVSPDECSVSHF
jgi:L-aspartate oxidase